jgi:hypothetical protein
MQHPVEPATKGEASSNAHSAYGVQPAEASRQPVDSAGRCTTGR